MGGNAIEKEENRTVTGAVFKLMPLRMAAHNEDLRHCVSQPEPSCESPRPRGFPLGFSSLFQPMGGEYERNGFFRPYGKLNWLTAGAKGFVSPHHCLHARNYWTDLQPTLSLLWDMHLVNRCLSEPSRASPMNAGRVQRGNASGGGDSQEGQRWSSCAPVPRRDIKLKTAAAVFFLFPLYCIYYTRYVANVTPSNIKQGLIFHLYYT